MHIYTSTLYQPAVCEVRGWLVLTRPVLRLLHIFRICLPVGLLVCVSPLTTCKIIVHCVTYIVAMQPYFSRLRQFRRLLCVATMSSLAQLRV